MSQTIHYHSILLDTHIYLGDFSHALVKINGRNIVILTDENLANAYPSLLEKFPHIIIPAGENSKSFQVLDYILSEMLRLNVNRQTVLLGFGGGVITDLTGFAASVYKRGINFIFMPTSLLGMTDASLGGKNGINFRGFKNQIGTINQPMFTWIDTNFLKTLPNAHFLNGLAELVKSCLIFSETIWNYLKCHANQLSKPETLQNLLSKAVYNKLQVVEKDVNDRGERQKLNFGHTFGHAIESKENILHGLAVSKGIVAALKLSVVRGFLSFEQAQAMVKVIRDIGLPVDFEFKPEYLSYINEDKKRVGHSLNFVFLKSPGQAVIQSIPLGELNLLIHEARNISF